MKAVVMAGGEGSRLRPLTSTRPKPLVPVAGRPIMEHILLHLRHHQVRDVIATVQYLGASIRNYFGDGSEAGVSLAYSVEDFPLGTAGAVKLVQDQLRETFLVVSGDALTDIDLGAAIRFHRERGAAATIVLKPVVNPLEYGVVVVDSQGAVQRFLEKPSWGEVFSDLANTGIYVLEPEVFEHFAKDQVVDWSGDVFPRLLEVGEPVYGWVADGYWEDVGSHAAYVKANFDCLRGLVRVDVPGTQVREGVWVAEDADLAPDVRVDGPALIGPGARVRSGAWLNEACVVGGFTTVDTGAKISSSIIWDHSYVGEGCRLRGAVVCRSVTLKNGCRLEEGSVVGSEVVMGAGSVVNANVRIWPSKEVEAGAVVRESVIWAGSWKRGLFTSYGLTGLTNVELTPEFAARLGAAVAALHPRGTRLAVSRDTSRAGRMILRALMSGMTSAGASIEDLSVLTIPNARHHVRTAGTGGVHVQTSPVDPRSADVRIFDSLGLDLDMRTERKLENLYFREDIRRVSHDEIGAIEATPDALGAYVRDMTGALDVASVRKASFKVLVDYDGGPSATALAPVLVELGCGVIPLNASVGQRAGGQDPVAYQARLAEMGVIVGAVGANLGVLIDAPGERCVLVDERGHVLSHEEAFGVLAQLALEAGPGVLLGPASTSLAFSLLATGAGGRFLPTKLTPGSVLRAAQHPETVLASDGAGGFCWPGFQLAFDALFTVARTLELMAFAGRTLSELRARIPAAGYRAVIEFCPWDAKGRVMRTVMQRHLDDRVDLTDGVKVFVERGWVLVVPDADRPEYHVIASTTEQADADRLVDEYVGLVREVVGGVRPEAAVTDAG
ncbi:MAG: sugar phosphate nucleotidyltransferase [Candidatus Dormibacterales bacterium]